jgi:hypothetical protein
MKGRLIIGLIGLALIGSLGGFLYSSCKPVWQFNHLEQNARKVVTASELQSWATSLLARNPSGTNLVPSYLGSDFPKQLLNLAPNLGPSIRIYEKDDNNYPLPCVHLYWGSGMLGAAGFEVGPTNFVSLQPGHAWQPGVHFYRR